LFLAVRDTWSFRWAVCILAHCELLYIHFK
jgi:hypothetical protein